MATMGRPPGREGIDPPELDADQGLRLRLLTARQAESLCTKSLRVAERGLRDRGRAKALLVEMGVFQASGNSTSGNHTVDPVAAIAQQKGITPESLRAFGAQAVSASGIKLPAYGPDGKPCTT